MAEPTEGGVVTSLPDDSFYILLKSLRWLCVCLLCKSVLCIVCVCVCVCVCVYSCRRAFSTANIDGACAMINNARCVCVCVCVGIFDSLCVCVAHCCSRSTRLNYVTNFTLSPPRQALG